MPLTLHGIPNCDTMRKARAWLHARGTAYAFRDHKRAGVDPAALDRWIDALGWEGVLNRAGTTFRRLPDADRADLDRARATAILLAHPSAIRRPILEGDGVLLAGFDPARWDAALPGGEAGRGDAAGHAA